MVLGTNFGQLEKLFQGETFMPGYKIRTTGMSYSVIRLMIETAEYLSHEHHYAVAARLRGIHVIACRRLASSGYYESGEHCLLALDCSASEEGQERQLLTALARHWAMHSETAHGMTDDEINRAADTAVASVSAKTYQSDSFCDFIASIKRGKNVFKPYDIIDYVAPVCQPDFVVSSQCA